MFLEALNPDESSELPEKFPPAHEQGFVNFAIKSEVTATTKFDRLKYMAEFRVSVYRTMLTLTFIFQKKLLALPDNFSTTPKQSSPTSSPTTTRMRSPSTHKSTVSQATKTASSTPQSPSTTTSFDDFVEKEKKTVLETIKILDRPEDLCDEPLHPKLEEDCKNDQWEIQWFFNSDRGACKSFWYGGCEIESRNFFPDHAVRFFGKILRNVSIIAELSTFLCSQVCYTCKFLIESLHSARRVEHSCSSP